MNTIRSAFPIDSSAILFFSLLRPEHSNSFRFTASLTEPVCPETLQRAADRVCARFPGIYAGFHPGFFSYSTVPLARAPRVEADPGLLRTMTAEEMKGSAIRIFYDRCHICVEMFHALTDGCGAIQSFRTLIAEYLFLRYGLHSAEHAEMMEAGEPDFPAELEDAYLGHASGPMGSLPNRHSYQLPGKDRDWQVKSTSRAFDTRQLLAAGKGHGVSMTTFLSALMAESIMEVQLRERAGRKLHPVRIMVPVDLRRLFPSRTLRNFVLYALPTLEPAQLQLPRGERMRNFQRQLKEQTTAGYLLPQIARNVRIQQSALFRCIPRAIKCGIMRIAYHFCGEGNSSITLTNLGAFGLSEGLRTYVRDVDLTMTPRRRSPYNCSILSCGDVTHINICRFGAEPDLENVFFGKLEKILK